jgi:hypothetical protein
LGIIKTLLRWRTRARDLPDRSLFLFCSSDHAVETRSPVRIKLNFNSVYLNLNGMQ